MNGFIMPPEHETWLKKNKNEGKQLNLTGRDFSIKIIDGLLNSGWHLEKNNKIYYLPRPSVLIPVKQLIRSEGYIPRPLGRYKGYVP
jgi:hypothetical protein